MTKNYSNIRVLCAAILLNSPMCMSMIYGNVTSYLYSVFYTWKEPRPSDLDPVWMHGLFLASQIFTHLMVDQVRRLIGLRLTAAVGVVLYVSSYVFTKFTVTHSVWATTLTFMVMGGIGCGMVVTVSFIYLAMWFDKRVGLASALTVSSSGIGGTVLNQIITTYINPNNRSPDAMKNKIMYFSQPEVVDRIPTMFFVLGAVIGGSMFMGFCLLKELPSVSEPSNLENGETGFLQKSSSDTQPHANSASNSNGTTTYGVGIRNNTEDDKPKDVAQNDIVVDKVPFEVIRSEVFYIIFCLALAETLGLLIVTSYYKLFGQLSISDDNFLALIASSSAIVDIFSRLSCGFLIDGYGVKVAVIVHLSVSSIFCSLWFFTSMLNKWVYFVSTNILLCAYNNQFVLVPVVTLKLFGTSYFATNLFLVNVSSLLVIFIAPSMMSLILHHFGWFWLFSFGSVTTVFAFLFATIRM